MTFFFKLSAVLRHQLGAKLIYLAGKANSCCSQEKLMTFLLDETIVEEKVEKADGQAQKEAGAFEKLDEEVKEGLRPTVFLKRTAKGAIFYRCFQTIVRFSLLLAPSCMH
jgi:hypothetical protein